MNCLFCGRESWRSKFCIGCRRIKETAGSIVSQNKKKMRKLLQVENLSAERFDKFILYSDNIVSYWKIVMRYKVVDTKTTFERIMNYWAITVCCVSWFFLFEILLISL